MQIQTEDPGWTAEIYGVEGEPPTELEGWGDPLTPQPFTTDEEETSVQLNDNESDHYLIWITELTPNDEGGYFATIGEVALFN